jgi:hypothetical protein
MTCLRALVLCAVLVTGCASSSTDGRSAGGHRTISVGFAAKGRTVHLSQGDSVRVRLASTYWHFAAPSGRVLSAGRPVARPAHGHVIAGSGSGTVTVTFRAVQKGNATITASRVSCGEAMRCVHGNGAFRLTVVVR